MKNNIVSVVLPVYNEVKVIENVIHTLLQQQLDGYEIEILVVDGMSNDGSTEIIKKIAQHDNRVRLLVNEKKKTPFALNIGIQQARGDYLCILGAHCEYSRDYIVTCIQEMKAHNAIGCSGKVITLTDSNNIEALLVSWIMGHPFGVSGHSFRTQPEGYADTIPYPVFQKYALIELGGYDESLIRNQDNDMNYRLRSKGYQLYCTWKTYCTYYSRTTLKSLFMYGYNNGFWCAENFRKDPKSLGFRHYVPPLFVLSIGISIVSGTVGTILLPNISQLIIWTVSSLHLILYFCLSLLASLWIAAERKNIFAILLPPLFFLFHTSYGFGFLAGLSRIVSNKTYAILVPLLTGKSKHE